MSVLVYAESSEGKYKKVAFEATSYGKQVADQLGVDLHVLTIGGENPSELGAYGASNIISVNNVTNNSDAKVVANVIKETANNKGATVIIIDSSANGLSITPLVAVNLNAGLATNVVAVPSSTTPFVVKRKAFSNKAFNSTQISSDVKVIGLAKNSFGILENKVEASVESFDATIISSGITSTSLDKSTGTVTIADAETVVSGGRGLKGPENWGMIEELATVLGAATACSKPVSDLGWRPHNEHVGQTGKPVSSNLYIAIGISGAIQHLAGINASKVKVVINTDPEAPFFKAADYGIVGDAFEVVPSLIEKLKAFKAQNA
ncbi:MAG: electron transfer flavoprotein subunit alpha [Bacteroidetes bacterium MedPE-SWsnd-G1]|nr:MAG: electron transfer flavoprotein subunit alpha [Bacteroidetes bacterium MedPE-SWsnd-G1]